MARRPVANSAEATIHDTFEVYRDAGIACLDVMPVPTAPSGMRGNRPVRVLCGKAPFDVYGWQFNGTFIGAEIKSTSQLKTSLSIVLPGSGGDGVQYHQLDALKQLASCNGTARIIWNNGGAWGVIGNEKIINAWNSATTAWKTSMAGKAPMMGAKSISWAIFEKIDYTQIRGQGAPVIDWLKLGDSP